MNTRLNMLNIRSYLLFLVLAVLPFLSESASAKTIYVSEAGSQTSPYDTWAKAANTITQLNAVLAGGDTVYFGTGVYDDAVMTLRSGTASDWTVFACSSFATSGETPVTNRPARIRGGQTITNWTQPGNLAGTNKWIADFTSTPAWAYAPIYQGTYAHEDPNILWRRTDSASVTAAGQCWHGNGHALVWCYNNEDPNDFVMGIPERKIAYLQEGSSSSTNLTYVKFIGLAFQNIWGRGFSDEDGDVKSKYIQWLNCSFSNIVGAGGSNNGYIMLMSGGNNVYINEFITVRSCSLGGAWSFHGNTETTNQLYSGNNAERFGLYTMRNSIIDSTVFWGRGGQSGIFFKCSWESGNPISEYDTLRHCKFDVNSPDLVGLFILGKLRYLSVYGNTFTNVRNGIVAHYGHYTWPEEAGHFQILNNTFYTEDGWYSQYDEHGYMAENHMFRGNVFKYNVCYATDDGSMNIDSLSFWNAGDIDSNIFYGVGSISWTSPTNRLNSLSTFRDQNWWQNTAGMDVNSEIGVDPGFDDPVNDDFNRSGSSQEMYKVYPDGYIATRYGAWQGISGPCEPPAPTATPTLASPANGATGLTEPIAFDWSDVASATSYEIQIDNNSDFSSPTIDQLPAGSAYSASGLATGTTYYWRARGRNACGWGPWSSSRNFTTCTGAAVPSFVSPTNGATGLSVPVTLDWSDVTGAINYHVQVDNNSDFSSPLIDQQSLTASTYSASGLASGVTYYWRIRARNSCGWGSWSVSRSFTTLTCAVPGVAALNTPANGATNVVQPVSFDWSDVSGATQYQIQCDNDANFASPIIDAQMAGSAHSGGGFANATLIYWRVRAQNACGWGNWSTSRSFTTSSGDFIAPTISNVVIDNITNNMARVAWTTNEPATSQINYGTTTAYGSSTTLDGTLVTEHMQVLSGLGPLTTYHLRVRSRDASSNEAISTDYSFATTESMNNLDNGIMPTVSSTYTGYTPSRITDGVLNPFGGTSTTWASNGVDTEPVWVEVDFGSSRVVKRAVVYWAWNPTQQIFMNSQQFRIQAWNGSSYADVMTVNTGSPDSTTYVDIVPTTTTRIRYYQPANMGPETYARFMWISEMDFFGQTNTAPTIPAPSSPANGATVAGTTPTLVVSNSSDPEGGTVVYDFQVSSNASFTAIVSQVAGVAQGGSGSTQWTVGTSLNQGSTYYWRCRAYDGALYSNYSTTRSFSIVTGNGAPNPPTPLLPTNNTRIIDMSPDLVVSNATDPNGDALTYQFYLYDESTTNLLAQSAMIAQGSATTQWTVAPDLAAKTKYTWRSRAYDGQAWSAYSTTRNFRTNRVPGVPTPISPIDGDTILGINPVYIVQNVVDPDGDSLTYDIQVFSDSLLTTLVDYIPGIQPGPSQTSVFASATLTPNQFYWWRARSNDSTHSSNWCEAEKFYPYQVILDAQDAPSIVAPLEGSKEQQGGLVMTISWTGSSDSSYCIFELSRDPECEFLVDGGSVKASETYASWTPTRDLDEGIYFWRAKRANSDYTAVSSFYLEAPVFVSPNPFVYSDGSVTVHNLPTGSRFEVYTPAGDRVARIDNLSGDFTWDVKNSTGDRLGSGVFLWYVTIEDKTISGKLIVQR